MHNKITFPNTVRSKRGEILYNNCTAALRANMILLHVLVQIYNINIYNIIHSTYFNFFIKCIRALSKYYGVIFSLFVCVLLLFCDDYDMIKQ